MSKREPIVSGGIGLIATRICIPRRELVTDRDSVNAESSPKRTVVRRPGLTQTRGYENSVSSCYVSHWHANYVFEQESVSESALQL